MAFLDNSGDIILDAVLTDEGRKKLARGDGSFAITKFALSDDEVDYSLYTPLTQSGYEDLRILQLPVFEAFTNKSASLQSKLLTYTNSDLLYLPVIQLNTLSGAGTPTGSLPSAPVGGYYVAADTDTATQLATDKITGTRFADARRAANQSRLVFDNGLNTSDLSLDYLGTTDPDLVETRYMVEVDNRLLNLATTAQGDNSNLARPISVNSDNIATYFFTLQEDASYFATQTNSGIVKNESKGVSPNFEINYNTTPASVENSAIGGSTTTGRLGTRLIFALRSTQTAEAGTTIWTDLGGNVTLSSTSYQYINTVLRITGVETGYRVEVPLKLLKKT
jgi:hypothetical protein